MKKSIYCKQPLEYRDGIPVFSVMDRYSANYEKIAADHIASIQPGVSNPFIEDELWKTLESATRDLIVKYARPADRLLLDVGVGLGRLIGPLEQFHRYGIDISWDYLDIARQQGIDAVYSRIEDMPYTDNTFDVVSVCDVLEHVLDLNLCTREILRVLKPGGFLIIRVPYKEDLTPYLDPALPYEFVHLRYFDEASLWLHFCKIFEMELLEASPVAPYIQGSPRLKIQLLPEIELNTLKDMIPRFSFKFNMLRRAISVSCEQLTDWIYALRDKDRDAYESVVKHLVLGIEINAVFSKKNASIG